MKKIGEAGYERIAFDNYRTPSWVTDCLLDSFNFYRFIWEPAAGEGDMVKALENKGHLVFSSDIRDINVQLPNYDFTAEQRGNFTGDIITNPPYYAAMEFIKNSLSLTKENKNKVAMLLGYEFDAPVSHREVFNHPAFFCKLVLPRRIKWLNLETKASPRQVHAWYIWDWSQDKNSYPIIKYIQ